MPPISASASHVARHQQYSDAEYQRSKRRPPLPRAPAFSSDQRHGAKPRRGTVAFLDASARGAASLQRRIGASSGS